MPHALERQRGGKNPAKKENRFCRLPMRGCAGAGLNPKPPPTATNDIIRRPPVASRRAARA